MQLNQYGNSALADTLGTKEDVQARWSPLESLKQRLPQQMSFGRKELFKISWGIERREQMQSQIQEKQEEEQDNKSNDENSAKSAAAEEKPQKKEISYEEIQRILSTGKVDNYDPMSQALKVDNV